MTIKSKMPIAIVGALLVLGSGSTVFAKAHDQGVADGDFPEMNTGQIVQNNGVPGISAVVNGGQRGGAASTNGGGNRVEPVVGNGKNAEANSASEPD